MISGISRTESQITAVCFSICSVDATEWSIRQTRKRFKEGWREKRGRHTCVCGKERAVVAK